MLRHQRIHVPFITNDGRPVCFTLLVAVCLSLLQCDTVDYPATGRCNYSAAYHTLEHIYGKLRVMYIES